jgi:hypothetical protein
MPETAGLTLRAVSKSDQGCAPAPDPGFTQCLVRDGDRECPAADYTDKHVFYGGLADTRDCSPCACSAPTGSTCSSVISAFKDGSCSPGALVVAASADAINPTCLDVTPSGQALSSKLATAPVYAPGICQVSGGEPTGQAIPADPTTCCCLPWHVPQGRVGRRVGLGGGALFDRLHQERVCDARQRAGERVEVPAEVGLDDARVHRVRGALGAFEFASQMTGATGSKWSKDPARSFHDMFHSFAVARAHGDARQYSVGQHDVVLESWPVIQRCLSAAGK